MEQVSVDKVSEEGGVGRLWLHTNDYPQQHTLIHGAS